MVQNLAGWQSLKAETWKYILPFLRAWNEREHKRLNTGIFAQRKEHKWERKGDAEDTGSIKWKMQKNIGLPFIRRLSFWWHDSIKKLRAEKILLLRKIFFILFLLFCYAWSDNTPKFFYIFITIIFCNLFSSDSISSFANIFIVTLFE